jgi:hypothetical protein
MFLSPVTDVPQGTKAVCIGLKIRHSNPARFTGGEPPK